MTTHTTDDPWVFGYQGYEADDEGLRESLCTLGNGYLATRAAFPGAFADGVHYPGTYVAGCYDRLTSEVADRSIENEALVNLPNWAWTQVAIDDDDWIAIDEVEVLEHEQRLDLRRGLLLRETRVRDARGRTTRLRERRLVHMAREHLAGLELTVVAENWSGRLRVRSGLDGRVANEGVERYSALASEHLVDHDTEVGDGLLVLRAATRTSRIRVAQSARIFLRQGDAELDVGRELVQQDDRIAYDCTVSLDAGTSVTLDKVVAVHTSRDPASFEPGHDARIELQATGGFVDLLEDHGLAWHGLWERLRVETELPADMDRILRVHLFHLLQTVSPNSRLHDVGVPPRGLHGEAYRGLIMWDEIFVLPILHLRLPSVTRSALAYRYQRLPAARRAAAAAGHEGAMFPWQSGSNGEEFAQEYHLNPESGRWLPDPTHRQRHIGLAVAYNVWTYVATTGDDAYLADQGEELMLEVARFFASLATYDQPSGRYAIRGVVGPDEFHTSYPDADEPGLDNNAYTNVLAAWLFRHVLELPDLLSEQRWSELATQLGIGAEDLQRWESLSRLLMVPFHDGVISQYEGYGDLEELDWDRLRDEYDDIHRLDRILESEGDTPDRYRASKQADALMLFYLLSTDELRSILDGLGYELDADAITRTIDYYLERTSHGSTLSAVVHAWVLARRHRERALEFLEQAFASDVNDIQGGTTSEGIHLGAMAGSVDLLFRCFTGLEVRNGQLHLDPVWPEELGKLEFDIHFRGHVLTLLARGETLRITSGAGDGPPITVRSPGESFALAHGQTIELHS